MKREAFLRELRHAGCLLKRHGKRHDLYTNPQNGRSAPVPRHTEIANSLCEVIRKPLGISEGA